MPKPLSEEELFILFCEKKLLGEKINSFYKIDSNYRIFSWGHYYMVPKKSSKKYITYLQYWPNEPSYNNHSWYVFETEEAAKQFILNKGWVCENE